MSLSTTRQAVSKSRVALTGHTAVELAPIAATAKTERELQILWDLRLPHRARPRHRQRRRQPQPIRLSTKPAATLRVLTV